LNDARWEKVIDLTSKYGSGKILELGAHERSIKDHLPILFVETADIESGCMHRFDCNERFPFKDSSYDTVIASDVIEHVENATFFLAEIHRTLVPGGILIISTPNIERNWRSYQRDDHVAFFTVHDFLWALYCAKFKITKVTGSSIGFTTDAFSWIPGIAWLSKKFGDVFPSLSYYIIAVATKDENLSDHTVQKRRKVASKAS
jgi:SAM-dependent methyltransferase